MKALLLTTGLLFSVMTYSQISHVNLQASGLTCSMCSNAINKALRSLDFVAKVDADIKSSSFDITFKPGSHVDFDKLRSKVEGAGFSVAGFLATVQFNNLRIKNNEDVLVGDKKFRFVNVKEQVLNGAKTIRVISKGFVAAKEFKKNNLPAATAGVFTVTI